MQSALIITGISGAEHCAASLSKQLGLPVEVAPSRREGMTALRRREYTIVVIDEPVAPGSHPHPVILRLAAKRRRTSRHHREPQRRTGSLTSKRDDIWVSHFDDSGGQVLSQASHAQHGN